VARAGAAAVADRFGAMVRPSDSVSSGQANTSAGPPAWAQTLRRHQTAAHGASVAAHAVRSGDHGSGGSSIPLSEDRR
ncbi:conjugal transfer protein TrbL, partial [Rhodoplanes elegans]